MLFLSYHGSHVSVQTLDVPVVSRDAETSPVPSMETESFDLMAVLLYSGTNSSATDHYYVVNAYGSQVYEMNDSIVRGPHQWTHFQNLICGRTNNQTHLHSWRCIGIGHLLLHHHLLRNPVSLASNLTTPNPIQRILRLISF